MTHPLARCFERDLRATIVAMPDPLRYGSRLIDVVSDELHHTMIQHKFATPFTAEAGHL
jgi:hypothetical protein